MATVAEPHQRRHDDALVTALREGDEEAFAVLVDSWAGWMLRLARVHVSTPSVAEEVVQETWLAVVKGLDRFRGDATLRTWVHRILLNQAKRRGVRERRTVPFASLTGDSAGATLDAARFQGSGAQHPDRQLPDDSPEQIALTREIEDVITTALEDLPPRQRTVVRLRDVDGHTAEEVCGLLGISPGNQRVLLHRGRNGVRAHLAEYLGGREQTPAVLTRKQAHGPPFRSATRARFLVRRQA